LFFTAPLDVDPLSYRRREVSQSRAWSERFGQSWPHVLSQSVFPFLAAIDEPLLGQSPDLTWPDLDSEGVRIKAEVHRNRFAVLLLLWVPRREVLKRKRILIGVG
jgi:hypothetical protein